jgi:hypothetical protein
MPKMMLPASPDDTTGESDTNCWKHIGIGMSYFSKGLILYAYSDATRSLSIAGSIISCIQMK